MDSGSTGPTEMGTPPSLPSPIQQVTLCTHTHPYLSPLNANTHLGHSRAWVITTSYKNGVFFFHTLYSSVIILSSASSLAALTSFPLL